MSLVLWGDRVSVGALPPIGTPKQLMIGLLLGDFNLPDFLM